MNGRSLDSSTSIHSYRYRYKNRSFEDQQFDNVFYGVPYDKNVTDITVQNVKNAVKHAIFNETGILVSKKKIEKEARSLYDLKGLECNQIIQDERIGKDLLHDTCAGEKNWNPRKLNWNFLEKPLNSSQGVKKKSKTSINWKLHVSTEAGRKRRRNSSSQYKSKVAKRSELIVESAKVDPSQLHKFKVTKGSELIVESAENDPGLNQPAENSDSTSKESKNNQSTSPEKLFDFFASVNNFNMLNDYSEDQVYHHHATNGDSTPDCNVATLLNMGNTCFLNSVLYALRFTPTFLHNLHHLLVDLSLVNSKLKETKTKTSSLGRNGSAISGTSWRSASSKDLLSIGANDIIPKSKEQIVMEKLHALYVTMNNLETKSAPDPYQPEALLQAMRDSNSLFEGNHQQDAHECFVELLSCLRVTCDKLNEQIEQNPELVKSSSEPTSNNNSKLWGVRRSWKKSLKKKDKGVSKKNSDIENEASATCESEDNLATDCCGEPINKKFGYNFISEDFEGVSLHRTICLECEEVSELKEPFLEIQVPVNYKDEDFNSAITESSIFGAMCVTSEKLCDPNKYFCEICNRYNEAQRTVLYEKLPNMMVLHLKRFTTSLSGVQKVNTYVPTPLEIRCFCESCNKVGKSKITPHKYRLSCVIMHLGSSLASGHYIAYSRATVETYDYVDCTRDIPKNFLNSSNKEFSNFLKFFKGKSFSNTLSETQNGVGPNSKRNDAQMCQSMNCCGAKYKLGSTQSNDWLEFDDEKVKTLSNKEFIDMLSRKHETTHTPYLLFYSKV